LAICLVLSVALGIGSAAAGELQGRITGAGEIGQSVVWIEGLVGGDVPKQDTVITHHDDQFEPSLSIGFVGNNFILRNDDNRLHNTHLYMRLNYQAAVSGRPLHYGATLYNVALPGAGVQVTRPIKPYHRYRDDTGFIEVVCNPHPEERAFLLVFDHPYATLTADDGTFSIADVPPGKHDVRVWHGGTVTNGQVVEVGDGTTDIVIELE
jgi:hypothetical protein